MGIALRHLTKSVCALLLIFASAISAYGQETAKNCVFVSTFYSTITTEFDTKCETTSLVVTAEVPSVFGGGDMKVRSRICIENLNGKWDCGSNTYDSGDKQVYWICNPTGRVIFDATLANGSEYKGCLRNYNKEKPFSWRFFSR